MAENNKNQGGLPGWVGPAANLVSAGANVLSNRSINKRTMRYNREMWEKDYQKQKEFWDLQNAYNSPREQMQRLQEAGLNPKLIYERGDMGNAGPLKADSEKPWNPVPENWGSGIGTAFESYFDIRQQKAQTDLTNEQIKLSKQDALLKTLDSAIKDTKVKSDKVQLDHFLEVKDIVVKQKLADLEKTEAETRYKLNEDERQQAMHAPNLIGALEQIALTRATTAKSEEERKRIMQGVRNMKLDEQIKELNIQLMKKGIYPGDSIVARILGRFLPDSFLDEKLGEDPVITLGKATARQAKKQFKKTEFYNWINRKIDGYKRGSGVKGW